MKNLLEVYERASGQAINLTKSDIYFSGEVALVRKQYLVGLLGVNLVDQHRIYLGIPTKLGRSKSTVFSGLAIKLTLLKSIAQCIPTYLVLVFCIPSGIVDRIESAMLRFWWGQKHHERKVYWVAWKKLCAPKMDSSLGLRDTRIFNKAMLAKQEGHGPSFTWRSILDGRELLQKCIGWMIGNGSKVKVWGDPWVLSMVEPVLVASKSVDNNGQMVHDLLNDDLTGWDRNRVDTLLPTEDMDVVMAIPILRTDMSDYLALRYTRDDIYKVKSGYNLWAEINNEDMVDHSELNLDAAILAEIGVGIGGVVRDVNGLVEWRYVQRVQGRMEVEAGEGMAALKGIQIVAARNIRKLVVEVDAQLLYKALRNPRNDLSFFGSVVTDILNMRGCFDELKFFWIRRTGNSVSHSLTSLSFTRYEPLLYDVLPEYCMAHIHADLQAF
ncbi:hypothetical protein ACS0TY_034471 [Phlomoides rotata]